MSLNSSHYCRSHQDISFILENIINGRSVCSEKRRNWFLVFLDIIKTILGTWQTKDLRQTMNHRPKNILIIFIKTDYFLIFWTVIGVLLVCTTISNETSLSGVSFLPFIPCNPIDQHTILIYPKCSISSHSKITTYMNKRFFKISGIFHWRALEL